MYSIAKRHTPFLEKFPISVCVFPAPVAPNAKTVKFPDVSNACLKKGHIDLENTSSF